MDSSSDLVSAAERVCAALRMHANTCQFEYDNIGAIIGRGEDLVGAVLEYERMLMNETGWSNPIRNLGPLPIFGDEDAGMPPAGGSGSRSDGQRPGDVVDLYVRYRVRVPDVGGLLALVSGKTGTEIEDPGAAVKLLYQCDGWDPTCYRPDLMIVDGVTVEATVGIDQDDCGASEVQR